VPSPAELRVPDDTEAWFDEQAHPPQL